MINWWLFIVITIPNFLRQVVYQKAKKKSGSFGFCVSPETRSMQRKKWLPWSGFLEELGWATLWSIAWSMGYEWFAFGWVTDALLDCAIAFAWSRGKREPIILFAGKKGSFFVREVLLPYILIGPILWALGLNIFFFSWIATVIGLILWVRT